jgi:Fe-S cluster assembly protein SufD
MAKTKTVELEFLELWNDNIDVICAPCEPVVNNCRSEAATKFIATGFPDNTNEEYQHTNIKAVFDYNYGIDITPREMNVDLHEVFKCDVPDLDTHTIFLVNGWYYKKNIAPEGLPAGVIITSFLKASKEHPVIFETYYNKQARESIDPMVNFNTMFAQDGLFIYIPKGVVLEKPIQIINILNSTHDMMVTQRGLFVFDDNSQGKVLICDHTMTEKRFVANHVRELFVGENAVVDYYLIENQHNMVSQIISTFIHQEKGSNVLSNFITLHNGLTRNNTFVNLAGEYAENHLYGMALTDKQQHVDNYTNVVHAVPNCVSNEFFKYVLDDYSSGAFRGRIYVAKDAQKTAAYQTNRNICLTPNAKMNTRPQLEIYADDVKCSHGATIGQLNEEALFYLRSRGIPEKEARLLLMFAFTHDVIENIRLEPLKERIHELVEKRFRGELSKCVGCAICKSTDINTLHKH